MATKRMYTTILCVPASQHLHESSEQVCWLSWNCQMTTECQSPTVFSPSNRLAKWCCHSCLINCYIYEGGYALLYKLQITVSITTTSALESNRKNVQTFVHFVRGGHALSLPHQSLCWPLCSLAMLPLAANHYYSRAPTLIYPRSTPVDVCLSAN